MDATKDYYAILGVHQTAEEIVIKVAYRALAQKYHPDAYTGSKDEAHKKMVLINEAYSVLSNTQHKMEYDKLRGSGVHSASTYYDETEGFNDTNDPLRNDWVVIIKYRPELEELDKSLDLISSRLSYTFRAILLETKQFTSAIQVAKTIKDDFLKSYFGSNKQILGFADYLINNNYKLAARELNKVVCVFGSGIDSVSVISKILVDFKIIKSEIDCNDCISCPICNTKQKLDQKEKEAKHFNCVDCNQVIYFTQKDAV